jgi:hypothetical protein
MRLTVAANSPQQNDSVTEVFTSPGLTSTKKLHSVAKASPRLPKNFTKAPPPMEVVKVIPVSGPMQYPPFFLPLGSPWNILFINLTIWLPELSQIELAHQDSVMIQYKLDNEWKALAGDKQLNAILLEFFHSKSDLRLRCAPESEFRSGSDSELDDLQNGRKNQGNDNGVPDIVVRDDKKIVG